MKDSDGDEQTTLLQDLRCSKIANAENATVAPGGNIGVFVDTISISKNTTEMTLKPVGGMNDGIYFGFTQKTPGGTNQRLTSGLATTIQSTGYFAGNSRQISANVDRQTGTVLDIFNYVIYKGQ